jgi:cytochrome P450
LHSFTRRIIRDKVKQRSDKNFRHESESIKATEQHESNVYLQSGRKRMAFMDMLVDHYISQNRYSSDQRLTLEDIREEVDTFMFEGFDTTAAAISWTIFMIGHSPKVQSRLFEELRSLPLDESYDAETLNGLKYTEACVKEALRMFPSVPIIARQLSKPMQLDECVLPTGVTIAIYIMGLHRDAKVFANPNEYRPERFLHPDTRHAYAYVPFSAGHRNCIGQKFAMMEAKSMVAHVYRNFHVQSTLPLDKLEYAIELITRPKSPLMVVMTPRDE